MDRLEREARNLRTAMDALCEAGSRSGGQACTWAYALALLGRPRHWREGCSGWRPRSACRGPREQPALRAAR